MALCCPGTPQTADPEWACSEIDVSRGTATHTVCLPYICETPSQLSQRPEVENYLFLFIFFILLYMEYV